MPASVSRPPPLEPAVKAAIRGIAFDTSAFGEGRPNLRFIASFAERAARIGLRTWIAEPVAWEWAEHLAADLRTFRTHVTAIRRKLSRAGLPTDDIGVSDSGNTVAAFMQQLNAIDHVDLLPLTGGVAVEALKDQILQRGAGSVKHSVKTGAADSAWLRLVLRVSGGHDHVVVVTKNRRDVHEQCAALGHDAPLMANAEHLPDLLFSFLPAQPHMTELIYQHLAANVADLANDPRTAGIDLGTIDVSGDSISDRSDGMTVDSVLVDSIIGTVGISSINVETDSGAAADALEPVLSATVDTTVLLFANLIASGHRLNREGDVVSDHVILPDTLLIAVATITVEDGAVTNWIAAGPTRAYPQPDDTYETAEDAFETAVAALSLLPGIDLPAEWGYELRNIELDTAAGRLHLNVAGSVPTDWVIEADLGSLHASISVYHDDTARVWDGHDGFDAFPPYRLTSVVHPQPPTHGPYGAVVAMTSAIIGAERAD